MMGMGLASSVSAGGSGFVPTNIAGCVLWLRADLGVTIATGVSQWADQSGNGHNMTQGTGANQPTFSASGGPNLQATITGNGTTQFMATSFSLSQPYEMLGVAKWVGGSAGTLCDGTTLNTARLFQSSAGTVSFSTDATVDTIQDTTTLTNFARFDIQANGTSGTGTWGTTNFTQAAGTGVGTNGFSGITLWQAAASGDFANLSLSEFIIYNSILSSGNRTTVQNYLKNRYALS